MPGGVAAEVVERPAQLARKVVAVCIVELLVDDELDVEAARGLVSRGLASLEEIVLRHGGTVEQLLGEEAVAVFGLPAAHEDDVLRALRSAMELRDALGAAPDAGRGGDGRGARRRGRTRPLGRRAHDRASREGGRAGGRDPARAVGRCPVGRRGVDGAVGRRRTGSSSWSRARPRSRGAPMRRSSAAGPSSSGSSLAVRESAAPRLPVAGSSCSASRGSARRGSRRSSSGRSGRGARPHRPLRPLRRGRDVPAARRDRRADRRRRGSSGLRSTRCSTASPTASRRRHGSTMRSRARAPSTAATSSGRPASSSRRSRASGRCSSCSRTCTGPNRRSSTCSSTSSAGAPAHRSRSSASHARSCSTRAPPGRPTRSRCGRSPTTRRRELLDALPESLALDADARAAVVAAAEGNPLFLEQLAAHALDEPLETGRVPASLESLLASRLDSLARRRAGRPRACRGRRSRVHARGRRRARAGRGARVGNGAARARPPAPRPARHRAPGARTRSCSTTR